MARLLLRIIYAMAATAISAAAAVLYFMPPLEHYAVSYLATFDYGILFETSWKLAQGIAPYLSTRGVHAWADNQDYFQILFSWVHFLPFPHQALIALHSAAIFFCGVAAMVFLRRKPVAALAAAVFVWCSPFTINMNIDLAHTEAFATILLLITFVSAYYGRSIWFLIALFLAIMCKEDVALSAAGLCAVLALRPRGFLLGRRAALAGIALCATVFLVNQLIVLPVYKELSCAKISSDYEPQKLANSEHASPWFSNLTTRLKTAQFWNQRLNGEALRYMVLLFWPLAVTAFRSGMFWGLPLIGATINLLAGGYLIKAGYHYDHSTFACVIMAVLLSLREARWAAPRALLLAAGAIWLCWDYAVPLPQTWRSAISQWCGGEECTRVIRVSLRSIPERRLRDLLPDERVALLLRLRDKLPRDAVISADYTSLNYLLGRVETSYMLNNPFSPSAFGIYGACDGYAAKLDLLPRPDLVVLYRDFKLKRAVWEAIRPHYIPYKRTDLKGSIQFFAWVRSDSARSSTLQELLMTTGFRDETIDESELQLEP